ncbi:MAG: hypothetical protein ACTHJW_25360 [Streptosporangiaceae bacterium]
MITRDRARFLLGRAVIFVLLAGAIAGCAALGAAIGTAAALRGAGYQRVGVNISTGIGRPAGGIVRVSYNRGPAGNDKQDAQRAERIVWHSLRYRFGALVVVRTSGGCAGPVCVSQSRRLGHLTYAQLAARFGPRPAGLDAAGSAGAFSVPAWAIALGVGLAVTVMAAAALVLTMILRSRRRTFRSL